MTLDEALDLLDRCYHSPAVNVVRAEVDRLRADLAAARALLAEARESWIKVGYGASHEDVADCSDLCRRIDAAIAGKDRT